MEVAPSETHGKLRDDLIKELFDFLPFGKFRVPYFLFLKRSLLPQTGEGDLTAPILISSPQVLTGFKSGVLVACSSARIIFAFSSAVKSSE